MLHVLSRRDADLDEFLNQVCPPLLFGHTTAGEKVKHCKLSTILVGSPTVDAVVWMVQL